MKIDKNIILEKLVGVVLLSSVVLSPQVFASNNCPDLSGVYAVDYSQCDPMKRGEYFDFPDKQFDKTNGYYNHLVVGDKMELVLTQTGCNTLQITTKEVDEPGLPRKFPTLNLDISSAKHSLTGMKIARTIHDPDEFLLNYRRSVFKFEKLDTGDLRVDLKSAFRRINTAYIIPIPVSETETLSCVMKRVN